MGAIDTACFVPRGIWTGSADATSVRRIQKRTPVDDAACDSVTPCSGFGRAIEAYSGNAKVAQRALRHSLPRLRISGASET